jgi:hypothetical protein
LNAKIVVIDHDILGWGEDHREGLLKTYQKIVKVGTEPGLERRKSDLVVASYCKKNDCDLLTGDLRAYQYYFDAGVKSVQISRYDWETGPDKAVFLIQILE